MAVVINEFELAPAGGQEEAGGQATAAVDGGQAAAGKPPKAPVQDVTRIMRRQHARMLRVTAY